jgi:hypothetical protein|tara:strand:+ start:96 stop:320 length:225 start_codon:yes stop_codon:yes gene_type:complete
MPVTRAQMYQQIKSGTRKKPKKKKFNTPGAKTRAKGNKTTKEQIAKGTSKGGQVVMRGFVKKIYDTVKGKKKKQ